MTSKFQMYFDNVEHARQEILDTVRGLTDVQASFQPSEEEWSVAQIIEHLAWAEEGGICGMFKAMEGQKNNKPIWTGESKNHGLSIEEIVQKTWEPKEKVPEVAAPKWGGPIDYWISRLENCQSLLTTLKEYCTGVHLESAIYPHPISGPLDIIQRLEFLRFHMERHLQQIERVKKHNEFPNS